MLLQSVLVWFLTAPFHTTMQLTQPTVFRFSSVDFAHCSQAPLKASAARRAANRAALPLLKQPRGWDGGLHPHRLKEIRGLYRGRRRVAEEFGKATGARERWVLTRLWVS